MSTPTKILLIGGNGQVGHELRRSLAPLGELVVTTRDGKLPGGIACQALDLADLERIGPLIRKLAPTVVVNAAAYTAVDAAEDDAGLAFRINAEAPQRIADACAAIDATVLHYSTDYVFDGAATTPYREDHPTAPLSVYGASKLAGETAIGSSGARHLILRTAWVYGLHGRNFLRTMLGLADREQLRVVADQIGSPTPAWLIADVSTTILRRGLGESGIHHLVSAGETSWHGFADAIFGLALARGLITRRPEVVPITTAEYPTRATRPAYSVLDTARLQREYALALPAWQDALNTTLAPSA